VSPKDTLKQPGRVILSPYEEGKGSPRAQQHRDETTRKQHEEMGFHDGWGKVPDQLAA
jgi:uncharacterized protein YndB with AHSA1/START domain